MELTKKQEEGLRIAVQRYKDREKYTTIAGLWDIKEILEEKEEVEPNGIN